MFVYLRKKKIASVVATNVLNDWYTSNDVLLMHMNNNANDVCGHAVTNTGVTFSSTYSKFGGYAGSFNGSSYLTLAKAPEFVFGTSDFTVEMWIYQTGASSGNPTLVSSGYSGATGAGDWALYFVASGLIYFNTGTASAMANHASTVNHTIALNTWTHIAYSRTGTTGRFFINGAQLGANVTDSSNYTSTQNLYIGQQADGSGKFVGYIDEVRITKGLARYTSAFTVPTKAFDDPVSVDLYYDNNVLLCPFSSDLKDKFGHTLSPNAVLSTAQTKFGSNVASVAGGNYISGSSSDFAFGTGDFTIDFWMYQTINQNQYIFTSGATPDWGSGDGVQLLSYQGNFALCVGTASNNALSALPAWNTWHHIAIVRVGGVVKLYVNGTAVGASFTSTTNITGQNFRFGAGTAGSWAAFNGYVQDLRFTKGVARYLANFNVPQLPVPTTSYELANYDPFYDNVALGMRFDNNLSDLTGKTITASNLTYSNTTYKFGTHAAYFNGTNTTVIYPPISLVGDFTIECWINLPISNGAACSILNQWNQTVGFGGYGIALNAQIISFYFGAISEASPVLTSGTISLNTWNHIAVTRQGSVFTLFVNGAVAQSANNATAGRTLTVNTTSGNYYNSSGTLGAAGAAYLNAYIDDLRITTGISRYNSAFTPVQQAFPYSKVPSNTYDSFAKQTVLALHFNGVNGSSAIKDECGRAFTPILSNAYITTATSKFGNGALRLNTTSSYAQIPNTTFSIGNSDYTVEMWVNFNSFNTGSNWLVQKASAWPTNSDLGFDIVAGPKIRYNAVNSTTILMSSATNLVAGTWYHVAVTRQGTTTRLFINGVQEAITSNLSYSVPDNQTNLTFGWTAAANSQDCYINDFRVTKAARYTANFTPTSFSLPVTGIADPTVLLMHFNDATEVKGKTVTNSGMVFNTNQAKFGTTSGFYTPYTKIYTTNTADMVFGTGDFTVEGWFYPTTFHATSSCLFSKNSSGNNNFLLVFTSTGALYWALNASGAATSVTSTRTVSLNQWYHIAVTRLNGICTVYVNGEAWIMQANAANITDQNPFGIGDYTHGNNFQGTFYVQEVRVSKACLYSANFTVPTTTFADTSTDPYQQYTALALHGDGANSSTNKIFLDTSPNNYSIAVTGNPTQGSVSPFSNSGWATYFDGASYLTANSSTAFDFGTGDFTLETWFMVTADSPADVGGNKAGTLISAHSGTGAAWNGWYMGLNGNTTGTGVNGLTFSTVVNQAQYLNQPNVPIYKNVWYHMAVCRSGTVTTIYLNGTNVGSVTLANQTANSGSGTLRLGALNLAGGYSQFFVGYMSNTRILKGVAAYTANFTPSTTNLVSTANTSLLANQSNTFKDNSSNKFALTVNGTIKISNYSPLARTVSYSTSTESGSIYFSGSDKFVMPTNTNFGFGTGDFTVELWVNCTFNGAVQEFIDGRTADNAQPFVLGISATGVARTYDGASIRTGGQLVASTWNHIAWVRIANVNTIYVNGVAGHTWTASQDFGATKPLTIGNNIGPTSEPFTGYMSNLRIVKGTGIYTSAFTPPTSPLTAVTGTQLLLSGANAGVIDSTGKNNVITVNAAQTSNSQSVFGSSSLKFSSTAADYLLIPNNQALAFGTGDFTIEAWVYPTAFNTYNFILNHAAGSTNATTDFELWMNASGNVVFSWFTGATILTNTTSGAVPLNAWTHVAVTRSSGYTRLYINGVVDASLTYNAGANNVLTSNYYVGNQFIGGRGLVGYMDDLRVTVGKARYAGNFTVPTKVFSISNTSEYSSRYSADPYAANVTLDVTFDGASPTDTTGNNVITATNVVCSSQQYMEGGAGYFSGSSSSFIATTNAAVTTSSAATGFGSGNFTIEFWFMPTAMVAGAYAALVDTRNATNSSTGIVIGYGTSYYPIVLYQGGQNDISISTPMKPNTWHHFALVRNGNVLTLYMNGINVGSNASFTRVLSDTSCLIGRSIDLTYGPIGFMDNLRITRGVARYIGNFDLSARMIK